MPKLLEYGKADMLLKKYGIKSVASRYLSSPEDAVRFSNGKPIVLKAITNKALHKSKSGLIAIDISTERQIREAFGRLSKKADKFRPYKILGQHMVKNGTEIIIGGNTDSQFGKLILIGLGGIYVETFKDFAIRVCPIKKRDAEAMIDQLKSGKIIAPDEKRMKMLVNLLLSAAKMFENSRASEIDLNPIILHDQTYDAVDIRILE